MPPLGIRSLRLRAVLALAALLSVAAAACGSEPPPNPESEDATTTSNSEPTPSTTGRTWAGSEPAPPFPDGLEWFNVAEPLSLDDLRGKIVLLDFWTLGCINCQHIIPDLQRLEAEFPDTLAVVGVHSGKYAAEQEDESIRDAIRRYDRTHPVVNDDDFVFWERYAVRAWPTLALLDPAGNIVGYHEGEGVYALFQPIIAALHDEFDGRIDSTPIPNAPGSASATSTVLRYPSALAADDERGRLYIADSGHNRIIVTNLTGDIERAIGTGQEGFADGAATEATFRQPHGLAVSDDGSTLYVADTRNHAIRAVDTETWDVHTIAGTGERLERFPTRGTTPRDAAMASPWGLHIHDNRLYIGMAGAHQVWVLDLDANTIEVFAGTSREGLDDGPRLDLATLAQPSGLTGDEGYLYWVDPEASAVRRVGYGVESIVDTLVGTGLFDYGNEDGGPGEGQLQHAQDIVHLNEILYIADTYNHAVRALEPGPRQLATLAGGGERGWTDGAGRDAAFDEPGGITTANGLLYVADTNNHLVRVIEPAGGMVSTLQLRNIGAIGAPSAGAITSVQVPAQAVAPGATNLRLRVTAPAGYQLNSLAPSRVRLASSNANVLEPGESAVEWSTDESQVEVPIPVQLAEGEATLTVSGEAYFCEKQATELCFIARFELIAPVNVRAEAEAGEVIVSHELPAS